MTEKEQMIKTGDFTETVKGKLIDGEIYILLDDVNREIRKIEEKVKKQSYIQGLKRASEIVDELKSYQQFGINHWIKADTIKQRLDEEIGK
jgi:hypothetical protein